MAMTIDERFTSIGWEDDSKIAQITTCNRPLQRKLTEYCKKYPDSFKKVRDITFEEEDEVDIMEFDIDKSLITIRQPKKMTAEQKKITAERLKKGKETKETKKKES